MKKHQKKIEKDFQETCNKIYFQIKQPEKLQIELIWKQLEEFKKKSGSSIENILSAFFLAVWGFAKIEDPDFKKWGGKIQDLERRINKIWKERLKISINGK